MLEVPPDKLYKDHKTSSKITHHSLYDKALETASATAQPCQDSLRQQSRTGMEEEGIPGWYWATREKTWKKRGLEVCSIVQSLGIKYTNLMRGAPSKPWEMSSPSQYRDPG